MGDSRWAVLRQSHVTVLRMDDVQFLDDVSDALKAIPGIRAVTLGGSRAQGTARPDSDWDLAIYYRGPFNPQSLRDLGWAGDVSEIGGWGGGVFNGGAWLTIDRRAVDVHYRDLDVVEAQIREASAGRFHIEPLMFHLAGIPSYLVVGELAINQVLKGTLPAPTYPEPLRRSAPDVWEQRATLTLDYAETNHAPRGCLTQCTGLLAVSACAYAHAVLAARGEWVTNEKTLLHRANMTNADAIIGGATAEPDDLVAAVLAMRELGRAQLTSARADM